MRTLIAWLVLSAWACTFDAPRRPIDPPLIQAGTLAPGFALTCKDEQGTRELTDSAPRAFSLTQPVSAALALPCAPPPIARPGQRLYPFTGSALDARLTATSTLVEHEPGDSMVQAVTFETDAHRICGRGNYGTAAAVRTRWDANLVLPASPTGRPFDVRVVAESSAVIPDAAADAELAKACALRVGDERTEGFGPGAQEVLRFSSLGDRALPIVLDCGVRFAATSLSMNTLGCMGAPDDPAQISPVRKKLRLRLEFRLETLR